MEIFFDPRDLMIGNLQPGRGGVGAQRQHLAFNAKGAAALAELENDLLDAAGGVRVISLEKMQNAHDVLASTARETARPSFTNETMLNRG